MFKKYSMLRYRILNSKIPLARRALQFTNSIIEASLAGPMNFAHVVEYPKCGGSWVRNMLRTYRGTKIFTYDRLLQKNDVILCHRCFTQRYKKPIVVVRDPRDLYVSFYHYENSFTLSDQHSPIFDDFQHNPNRPVRDDFNEYLKVKLTKPSHPWFYYSQFLDSWLNVQENCLIRYEDCLKDPESQLISMIRFLNDPLDLERLEETVRTTSFAAVTEQKYGERRETGETDNTKFHRKGISGDWKNHFNESSCKLIETIEGRSLRRLGYETNANWITDFTDTLCG